MFFLLYAPLILDLLVNDADGKSPKITRPLVVMNFMVIFHPMGSIESVKNHQLNNKSNLIHPKDH